MAMTDAQAMNKAILLWGISAQIAKIQTPASTKWTYQVGCVQGMHFVVVAQGTSWDKAFAVVPSTGFVSFRPDDKLQAPTTQGIGAATLCQIVVLTGPSGPVKFR